jgi:CxxC motif-containing protein (DUF1111 family)
MFENRWALFWFENAEFGRGPISNAQACTTCHANNGRGLVAGTPPLPSVAAPGEARDHHITVPFEPAPNLVVRLSLPGTDAHGGPRVNPEYGDQLQIFGVKGVVPPEGSFSVDWTERLVTLADGDTVRLRQPVLRVAQLAYGPLGQGAMTTLRLAPALVGLGLLEAVPDQTLRDLAARPAVDGIRGRVNEVWDPSQQRVAIGRFGLKANHGSLREQVAIAFLTDIATGELVEPEAVESALELHADAILPVAADGAPCARACRAVSSPMRVIASRMIRRGRAHTVSRCASTATVSPKASQRCHGFKDNPPATGSRVPRARPGPPAARAWGCRGAA